MPTTSLPAGDRGLVQQFTPVSARIWWVLVADNLELKSYVARTVDSGRDWHDVALPVRDIGSADFLDADIAWLAGAGSGEPGSAPLYRTRNGGRTWQKLGTVPDCEVQFVDRIHGWCTLIGAAMGSESVEIYRTINAGATWTLVSRTAVAGTGTDTLDAVPFGCDKSVTFTSTTVGWIPFYCDGGTGTAATVYKSTDAGSTWHPLPPVVFPGGVHTDSGSGVSGPVARGDDVALTVEISGTPNRTAITTSTDGGMTWRTRFVPDAAMPWNVDLIDPRHWRLTDGRVIMATDDAGEHWRTTAPARVLHDPRRGPLGLDFLSPVLGWTTPGSDGGRFWWTRDGGRTWSPIAITAGPYRLPASRD